MKKRDRIVSALLCAALLCLAAAGCAPTRDKETTQPTATPGTLLEPPATTPTMQPTNASPPEATAEPTATPQPTPCPISILYEDGVVNSITVKIGAEFTLSADTQGLGGDVVFSSDDETVAQCDVDGKVKALSAGTANITARLGEAETICKVTVTKPVKPTVSICYAGSPVYDFTLNGMSSETIQLRAEISPADSESMVVWSSSDPLIADVSPDGLVTALTEGSAKIICTCGEGKAECWVRVRGNRPAQIQAGDTVDGNEALVVITYSGYVSTDFTISVGESIDMNYKLYNTDENQSASWSIKDPSIASIDQNGTVTGLKEGSTEMYISCGSLSSACIVRVKK